MTFRLQRVLSLTLLVATLSSAQAAEPADPSNAAPVAAAITASSNAVRSTSLVVGVNENLQTDLRQEQVQPLAQLLSTALGTPVHLRVMNGAAIDRAVTRNEVDLLLTGPVHYLVLRSRSALTGVLATMVRRNGDAATASLGGVIVARRGKLVADKPNGRPVQPAAN